jgi:hypothetical protein
LPSGMRSGRTERANPCEAHLLITRALPQHTAQHTVGASRDGVRPIVNVAFITGEPGVWLVARGRGAEPWRSVAPRPASPPIALAWSRGVVQPSSECGRASARAWGETGTASRSAARREMANGALDEPVLLRLAWRDVVPADAGRVGPAQDRVRDQLAVVVGSDLGEDDIIRFEDPYGRE